MFGAYLIINFLDSFPYGSYLTIWISIYFFVAYFKKYGLNYCDNIKANFIMLCLAFCGHLGSILLINYLGLHNSFFVKLMLKWNKNANVFAVLICFSLFNLFFNSGLDISLISPLDSKSSKQFIFIPP